VPIGHYSTLLPHALILLAQAAGKRGGGAFGHGGGPVTPFSLAEIFIPIWLVSALLMYSAGSVWVWHWLERHGAKLQLFRLAIPGYLNRTLYDWCRENGRTRVSQRVLRWRRVLLLNMIAAGLAFVFFSSR
jgi:hypothetical protein